MDIGVFYYSQFVIGDANQDGSIDILDISTILDFILSRNRLIIRVILSFLCKACKKTNNFMGPS